MDTAEGRTYPNANEQVLFRPDVSKDRKSTRLNSSHDP
jgi:hypothetical protein